MKTTGMQNLQNFDKIVTKNPMELETGPADDTSISLAISSDKSTDDHEDDPDPDSAIGVSEAIQTAAIPEMSFRPLDLSETRSTSQSSNWSQNEIKEAEISQQPQATNEAENKEAEAEAKKENLQKKDEIFATVGAKVQDYLNKMRTDKRFEVTLGSLDKSKDIPEDTTSKFSFNTDLDSTTLTETKFRKGLESSLDLSDE